MENALFLKFIHKKCFVWNFSFFDMPAITLIQFRVEKLVHWLYESLNYCEYDCIDNGYSVYTETEKKNLRTKRIRWYRIFFHIIQILVYFIYHLFIYSQSMFKLLLSSERFTCFISFHSNSLEISTSPCLALCNGYDHLSTTSIQPLGLYLSVCVCLPDFFQIELGTLSRRFWILTTTTTFQFVLESLIPSENMIFSYTCICSGFCCCIGICNRHKCQYSWFNEKNVHENCSLADEFAHNYIS